MPAADVAWLHMDRPTNLMVVNVVFIFDTLVDWDRVKEVCRERLVERFPRFSQRVVESGIPWRSVAWEDDPRFDLERHFHRLALPAPRDRAALLELVADMMATPLDHYKPLWDIHLVEGYGSGCAIVLRVHHCIADGIALSRVLQSLTDDNPTGEVIPAPLAPVRQRGRAMQAKSPAADVVPADRQAANALVREGAHIHAHRRQPSRLVRVANDHLRALTKSLLTGPDARTILKGELGVAQRVATTHSIRLAEVKHIAHAAGATINDVMLTAVTGALRSYLRERDTPVSEIHASVPINLRPLSDPIPRELGNKFGVAVLALPIGTSDPQERLGEIHRRMAAIKDSSEGAVSYTILRIAGMTPLNIERALIESTTAKASAVITNVPGPQHPVYLAGTPVRSVIAWAPKPGSLSICVTIFSYNGEITLGLAVDAGLISDPERILAGVEVELAALRSLAHDGGTVSQAQTGSRPN